jgi:hypothetical protein
VIHCEGYQFKTEFMKRNLHFQDCVSLDGQIYVNDFLQVTNKNPLLRPDEPQYMIAEKVFPTIFALGDCCLTRVNEEKSLEPLKI